MRKVLSIITALALVASCAITKPNTPGTNTQVNVKDSTVINTIDSVIIIPVERVVDIVAQYDTLRMETSKAKAEAYVDTTLHILRGKIENKTGIEYKYIYKDKIVYKDSISLKEVPVPYEVVKEVTKIPKIFWWMLGLAILLVGYEVVKIYLKIKTAGFKSIV